MQAAGVIVVLVLSLVEASASWAMVAAAGQGRAGGRAGLAKKGWQCAY
jgi:hypothetical protein